MLLKEQKSIPATLTCASTMLRAEDTKQKVRQSLPSNSHSNWGRPYIKVQIMADGKARWYLASSRRVARCIKMPPRALESDREMVPHQEGSECSGLLGYLVRKKRDPPCSWQVVPKMPAEVVTDTIYCHMATLVFLICH